MKKTVLLVVLLTLISASVQAITVEKWTLQGVASYAQALFASVSGGGSGGAGNGWLSGNATDPFSIPIWDSTTNTWTARTMLPTGISAASAKQPLSITASGTLQYLFPGGEWTSLIPTAVYPGEVGNDQADIPFGSNPITLWTNTSDTDTTIESIADHDSTTYRRLEDVFDNLDSPIEVWFDQTDGYMGQNWVINGYAFQVASTTTPGPASWKFKVYDDRVPAHWDTMEEITATATLQPGEWYCSAASFATEVDGVGWTPNTWFRLSLLSASGSYVDISEFRLLKAPATAAAWIDTRPPATFTSQAITFAPSSSVPTATGSVYADTGSVVRVRDQHGASSVILTDYPRWNDLRVPLLTTNAGGTNAPTPVVVKVNGGSQGVFAFQFSATTEQELYCSVQLPHDLYKTHAHPHVHWITPTPAANATAVWGIEYCIANVNAAYPAATTIATAAGGAGNVAFKHVLTELPEIDLSQAKDSSVLLVRFFRDATNASDTLGACWASDFDLHVQIRDRGSLLEYGDN